MDPVYGIITWVATNWFPLVVGAAVTCGLVHIDNPFKKK